MTYFIFFFPVLATLFLIHTSYHFTIAIASSLLFSYGAGATVAVPPRGLLLYWIIIIVIILTISDSFFDVGSL